MNVYKCRICEDPYVGNTKPSNCPFCGAPAKYIILAENWVDADRVRLTDASRENLEVSLRMEIESIQFYRCAMRAAEDPLARDMFKALSRIETEHAASVCKLLGRSKERVRDDSHVCSATSSEDHIRETLKRERDAVKFYRLAAETAKEEHVKEFFEALTEIEEDHISLSNLSLGVA